MTALPDLYIFVEGSDDARFFESIIVPRVGSKYRECHILEYSQQTHEWVRGFVRGVLHQRHHLLFVADKNYFPCVTARKTDLTTRFPEIPEDRLCIVVCEIEGWYLGGIGAPVWKKLGLQKSPYSRNTDSLRKQAFDRLIPKEFSDARGAFLVELLRHFDHLQARRKNHSYARLVRKWVLAS